MLSTASTRDCRGTRIWSACFPGASSTTSARRCGWPGAATRRTRLIRRPAVAPACWWAPAARSTTIGAGVDRAGFDEFYRRCRMVTQRLWPTLMQPLRTATDARRHVTDGGDPDAGAAWDALFRRPIGTAITDAVGNDLVRGVMATDALIGTFARTDDPSLAQNVCFLYHLLGGGTGDWDVPIGGMGAVTDALAAAASATVPNSSLVQRFTRSHPDGEVRYRKDGRRACRQRALGAGRRHAGSARAAARRSRTRARARSPGKGQPDAGAAAPTSRPIRGP